MLLLLGNNCRVTKLSDTLFLKVDRGIYLNLNILCMAGPSTLNVQSVKVMANGLVKEIDASHCLPTRGCVFSYKNKLD